MKKQNINVDKLSDKASARLMISCVLGILVCMVCLCSTTYAWYNDSVSTAGNEIKVATDCLLEMTLSCDGEIIDGIEEGVELEAGKTYTMKLLLPANTASGYCVITSEELSYRTDYIARHEDSVAHEISFSLSVATTRVVTFTPRWGLYVGDSDVQENALLIP